MKLIFSRKGFDSGYGGIASPVLPDGRIASFPIPSSSGRPAADIQIFGSSLGAVVSDLTNGRLGENTRVHLDPDLDFGAVPREPGWCPSFGQVGAAQSHLAKQGVGVGDLFLFFGWFRHAELLANGGWQYVKDSPSFHGLFGWLQITDILKINTITQYEAPKWLASHPHVESADKFTSKNNTIYIANGKLNLGGKQTNLPAGGMFSNWTPKARLSASGKNKSVWQVPSWMEPVLGRKALSYHSIPKRWIRDGDNLNLQTVAKGQEFVLDTSEYKEAVDWAYEIIKEHA